MGNSLKKFSSSDVKSCYAFLDVAIMTCSLGGSILVDWCHMFQNLAPSHQTEC